VGILKRPYREIGTTGERVIAIFVFGLFIFLFLFLFKPFGLAELKTIQVLLVTPHFNLSPRLLIWSPQYRYVDHISLA
jgi:hypothetical protein